MVAESHACPSCGESVPPGRLSCPFCGAVLAAVVHRAEVAPGPVGAAGPAGAAEPAGWIPDAAHIEPPGDEAAPAPRSPWPMVAPAVTADAPTWAPAPPPTTGPPAAGTYVPPAATPAAAEQPALSNATADPPVDLPPAAILPRAWDPAAAAAGQGAAAVSSPRAAGLGRLALPRLDRQRVEEAADMGMMVGAFGLVLSFLAPWADVVIGSRGTGYLDTWGLAGSGHIALFLLALAVLTLAVVQNPIGRWLRTGVTGVALGGFVLGLAWPYVVGPLGAGPGALLAWVSGLVIFVAGLISLLVLRHAALLPDV